MPFAGRQAHRLRDEITEYLRDLREQRTHDHASDAGGASGDRLAGPIGAVWAEDVGTALLVRCAVAFT